MAGNATKLKWPSGCRQRVDMMGRLLEADRARFPFFLCCPIPERGGVLRVGAQQKTTIDMCAQWRVGAQLIGLIKLNHLPSGTEKLCCFCCPGGVGRFIPPRVRGTS